MNDDTIYLLIEKDIRLKDMGVYDLYEHFENGYATYDTPEEAEEGRKRGDAYDDISRTRVVGFKVTPFLPKHKRGTKNEV